jgi:hypothetical protein
MRKSYIVGLAIFCISLTLVLKKGFANQSGAPAGYTGAPGDNPSACVAGGCHTTLTGGGQVTVEVLDNGTAVTKFVPGKKYTVHISTSGGSAVVYGFEATVKNSKNRTTGTITVTDNAHTQHCFGFNTYITHTYPTTTGDWSFDWTASTTDTTSTITVYAAVNFANGDGNNTGDHISKGKSSTLLRSGISEKENLFVSNLRYYPNPVQDYLTINYTLARPTPVSIKLFTLDGRLLQDKENINSISGDNISSLEMSRLPKGIYVLQLSSEEGTTSRKIEKL